MRPLPRFVGLDGSTDGRSTSAHIRRGLALLASVGTLAALIVAVALHHYVAQRIHPLPSTLVASSLVDTLANRPSGQLSQPIAVLARDGELLEEDREQRSVGHTFNVHREVSLDEIPPLLVDAFLFAEDQRFYRHQGVDWRARAHAVVQNLRSREAVRGASTITEQVVRILNPRPRTLQSRLVEHVEAKRLEESFSKDEILTFYLNQVPYGRNRRGVTQAALEYFGRDLKTLSIEEQLTLAVLVRSPSWLDPMTHPGRAHSRVAILGKRLLAADLLTRAEFGHLGEHALDTRRGQGHTAAAHFVEFARREAQRVDLENSRQSYRTKRGPNSRQVLETTLDGTLQRQVQALLENTLEHLEDKAVSDGAVLVVDHETDEVLAWVNAWGRGEHPGSHYDKILVPRQPGSALKPFVYALALEQGWSAATIIDDAPIEEQISHGVHAYQNYSRSYYGPVRLREALGNSLNTTAIRAVRFVGPELVRQRLEEMAVTSLDRDTAFYGDGLALGNAELSLFELVGGYATLARGGIYRPLRVDRATTAVGEQRMVFDHQVATLIADILSDPEARTLEFGTGSILDLPAQTAVKTGTSSDHRDAWAVGFNHRFTVGVWMGNIDHTPTHGVSGATGPALVLRSVFSKLENSVESRRLVLDNRLLQTEVCEQTGLLPGALCPVVSEWLRRDDLNRIETSRCEEHPRRHLRAHASSNGINIAQLEKGALPLKAEAGFLSPTPGLHLALDPRIPDELEGFRFEVATARHDAAGVEVEWELNGRSLGRSQALHYDWEPVRGRHSLKATVFIEGKPIPAGQVAFEVR